MPGSAQERRANHTALRDLLVSFGVEVDQSQLVSAQKNINTLLGTFSKGQKLLAGFAAALGVRELVGFITSTVSAADDVGDLAARLGIATDQFQVLKAVAEDAGTSVGAIQGAFRNLAAQVQGGGKELSQLGVALKDAGGHQKNTTDLFWEAGEAIGAVEDQNKRLAMAQKLFGRSALDLIPIFTAEKGSLDELQEAAVVFSDEMIASADRTSKKLAVLDLRWQKIKALIVQQLLPAFNWFVDKAERVVVAITKWTKSGGALNAAITALMMVVPGLVAALAPLAAEFLLMAAPVVALFLALEDLVTFMRGGDSLIGRFLNTVFGAGVGDETRAAIMGILDGFKLLVQFLAGSIGADEFADSFLTATAGVKIAIDDLVAYVKRSLDELSDYGATKLKGLFGDTVGGFIFGDDVKKTRENRGKVDTAMSGASFTPGYSPFWDMKFPPGGVPAIAPEPSLGPASGGRMGVTTLEDSRHQEITVNVQGNASADVARKIGTETARAIGTLGRDPAAIGAAMGVSQ